MNPTFSTRSALVLLSTLTILTVGCGGAEPGAEAQTTAGVGTTASALKVGSGNAVGISTFSLAAPTVTAGKSIIGTVTLAGPAQAASGGVNVYLTFRNAVLAGPKFIHIPNGLSSGTFTLYSNAYLSASTTTSISATTSSPQPASFVAQTLSIDPSPTPPASPAPQVSSLTLSPAVVTTGSPSTGTVTITEPAPAGGAVVQLSNSGDFFNLDADLPPVLVIPAGATSATFPIHTHVTGSVITTIGEIIVGNYFGGVFQGAYLTINR
jgi:hypothetical protein